MVAARSKSRLRPASPLASRLPIGTPVDDIWPHADLLLLAHEVRIKAYGAGETLQRDGDEAFHVMALKSGSAKCYKQLADGRTSVVGFLFGGDFIGLATLEFYSSGVEALEPVEAWRFPRAAFRQLVAERPNLEAALLLRVTHDLEVAQEQMLLLSRKTAVERLASFLLQLGLREHEDCDGQVMVPLHMSRADMADYLGLTTETVSRCFSKLRSAGLISLQQPTSVLLLEQRTLQALAAGSKSHY